MKKLYIMFIFIFCMSIFNSFAVIKADILAEINNAKTVEEIQSIIYEEAEFLGLDLTGINSLSSDEQTKVYTALLSKDYSLVSELQDMLNNEVSKIENTKNSSGGGGGGGGNFYTSALEGSFTLSDDTPAEGDKVTVTANIKNIHTENVVINSAVLQYGETLSESAGSCTLIPNQTMSVSKDYQFITLPATIELLVDGTKIASILVGGASLEFSNVQFEQKDDILIDNVTCSVFNLTGTVKNVGYISTGYVSIKAVKGANTFNDQNINPIDKRSEAAFDFTVAIPDFTASQLEITILAESGDANASQSLTLVNKFVPTDITIDHVVPLTVVINKSSIIRAQVIPSTASQEYSVSVADTSIATVNADGKSITAVKAGTTKLTVSSGTISKEIDLYVCQDYELHALSVYYLNGNNEKVTIPFNNPFKPSVYQGYRVDLTDNIKSIGISYRVLEGSTVQVAKSDGDTEKAIGDLNSISVPILGMDTILVHVNTTSGAATYRILINFVPFVTNKFPDEIMVYTGLECKREITNFFDDEEDEQNLKDIYFEDSNGEEVGTIKKEDNDIFWIYKSDKDTEGMDAKFVLIDGDNAKTETPITIISEKDTEKPTWNTDNEPSASNITTSSATIKWNKASDNDEIDYYTVYYYDKISRLKSKTVTSEEDVSLLAKLTGLSSNTEYNVYIEAVDRSGNTKKSVTTEFRTNKSSSGGTGGSSGSGSGTQTGNSPTETNQPPANNNKRFSDLGDYNWAENEINTLADKGIINGISDTQYAPENNITRADFITLLVRGLKLEGEAAGNFSDVEDGSYYYDTIGTARALGIVTGGTDGTFRPKDNISRQDMIVMTARAMKYAEKLTYTKDGNVFADDAEINDYAKESVYALAVAGIIKGDQNGNTRPLSFTTRAEAAVIIYRILGD